MNGAWPFWSDAGNAPTWDWNNYISHQHVWQAEGDALDRYQFSPAGFSFHNGAAGHVLTLPTKFLPLEVSLEPLGNNILPYEDHQPMSTHIDYSIPQLEDVMPRMPAPFDFETLLNVDIPLSAYETSTAEQDMTAAQGSIGSLSVSPNEVGQSKKRELDTMNGSGNPSVAPVRNRINTVKPEMGELKTLEKPKKIRRQTKASPNVRNSQ